MANSSYHMLPDLLPEEYEALKASIAEHGVDIPKVVDQDGNTLDGRHRQRACDELGRDCPTEVRCFASEAEKYEFIVRVNCQRRQLNRKQKEKLIEVYLLRDPQIADNNLASLIGVSKNTVAKARTHLEATCQIDKFDRLRGRDGKKRPTKYKRIFANNAKEAEAAMEVIQYLPNSCDGRMIDVVTAERRARHNRKQQEIADKVVVPVTHDDIKLFHCRFQDLEQAADLKPSSVRLILTDIPYHAEFLSQVSELGSLASRLLVPGGLLVMQTGGLYVREIERCLDEYLTWRHTGVTVWEGDANMLFPIQCASQCKPVLIYSKGKWTPFCRWGDVSRVTGKEKKLHPHQQPLEDVEFWLRQFSESGDLVVDVCGGSFTVAVACFLHGRRFVGCDCDESSVETGRKRLAAVAAGLPDPAADDGSEEELSCRVRLPLLRSVGPAPNPFVLSHVEQWKGRKLSALEESIRRFFGDKSWWVGGSIPLAFVYRSRNISLLLQTETNAGLQQAGEVLGDDLELKGLTEEMQTRGIDERYHGGLALLYVRLCRGLEIPSDQAGLAS